tara:strand:+ start:35 stop:352 length:318 start_codon:yes stop_codon:yes gene_type:complete
MTSADLQSVGMEMDKKTVSKIADLAKIQIDDNQIENIVVNLEKILDLVDEMNSVNTDSIQPMSHPLNLKQELRVDEVTEENLRDTFQENSDTAENGYYKVPKIID